MSNKNIIAIDGPAASGKGTLARKIAEELGYAHLDTGLLYRAVGYMVLEIGQSPENHEAAIQSAQKLSVILSQNPPPPEGEGRGGGLRSLIIGTFVPPPPTPSPWEGRIDLKAETVTQAASKVAAIAEVRNILLKLQKDFADSPGGDYRGAVLDGRDIGTIICPQATVKLFITASLETRADRRFKELQNKGVSTTYEAVLRDMRERDSRDAARAAAPMRAADDAVTLDTTKLNQQQALEKALEIVRKKLS